MKEKTYTEQQVNDLIKKTKQETYEIITNKINKYLAIEMRTGKQVLVKSNLLIALREIKKELNIRGKKNESNK